MGDSDSQRLGREVDETPKKSPNGGENPTEKSKHGR